MMEKQLNDKNIRQRCEIFDENFSYVKDKIADAAKKSGRKPEDVKLLAATKTVPAEVINHALSRGITLMGENRAQELCEKFDSLSAGPESIHFIGSLQTNKVSMILNKVSMIESVNSEHLAEFISKKSLDEGKTTDILVEVNVGEEDTKTGIPTESLYQMLEKISSFKGISVRGLMAIPPFCENPDHSRKYFSIIYKLFVDIRDKNWDNVNMDFLSMGMSHDFSQAIEEGAGIVRVGSLLFGERIYPAK